MGLKWGNGKTCLQRLELSCIIFYLEKEDIRSKSYDLVNSTTRLWEYQLFSYIACTLQVPFLVLVLFFFQAVYSRCHGQEDQHVADADPFPLKFINSICSQDCCPVSSALFSTSYMWFQLKEDSELPLPSSTPHGNATDCQASVFFLDIFLGLFLKAALMQTGQ